MINVTYIIYVFNVSRQVGEDSDGDYFRDSCSDGSSDYETEKGMKFSGEQRHHNHLNSQNSFRMSRLSIQDEHSSMHEGFSSDDGEVQNSQGVLLFEYLERNPPYSREPLADKASRFSQTVYNSSFVVWPFRESHLVSCVQ